MHLRFSKCSNVSNKDVDFCWSSTRTGGLKKKNNKPSSGHLFLGCSSVRWEPDGSQRADLVARLSCTVSTWEGVRLDGDCHARLRHRSQLQLVWHLASLFFQPDSTMMDLAIQDILFFSNQLQPRA